MSGPLAALEVLVVDCQASGATPAHGDLLELGWSVTTAERDVHPARASWVVPVTTRPVSRIVRELTGWDEEALAASIPPADAWASLAAVVSAGGARAPMPTVIHWARFELPFLRALHASHAGDGPFPFDIVCLHAIGARLLPDLPRRSLRALAGHLGASPQMIRRAHGHVDASSFVWRALVPRLAALGIADWEALGAWLSDPPKSTRAPAGTKKTRAYPMEETKRRALPDAPGVYRFLRPSGDVLYVGKAASLRKRVASHFKKGARSTERALEMLSQAHDLEVTVTATALEAALLEVDEIKRLDPPYNVHLRAGDRRAWFATADWSDAASVPSGRMRVGPLPSRTSVSGIGAVRELLLGASAEDPVRRARAVRVPPPFAPPRELFEEGFRTFCAEELAGAGSLEQRILAASARIVVQDSDDDLESEAPDGWDLVTVRRYLERVVVTEGTLVRRARLLALLACARITYREHGNDTPRELVLGEGERPPSRAARLASFDAARYDRLRVLATELRRVTAEGGDVTVRVGRHDITRASFPRSRPAPRR
ncbi:MAG: uvrC 1 [Labilithrix sp.]|nr:uvrC 1 [Labilithrix sp.]